MSAAGNSGMVMAQVRLPNNVHTGQKLHIQLPQFGAFKFQIVVPPGVRGGQTIKVNVPRPHTSNVRLAAVQAHRDQRLRPSSPPAAPPPRPPTMLRRPSGEGGGGAPRLAATTTATTTRTTTRTTVAAPLWKGWFLKQQPHWPHQFQRRYGHLVAVSSNGVPAADGRFGHELRYGKEPGELLGGGKESVRSLPIGTKPMCPSGRLAIEGSPGADGKLLLRLSTVQRDYTLAITPAVEGVAFYRAVRVLVCGDHANAVDAALGPGPGANLPRLASEQQRLAAMGFDRFDCDVALVRSAGDSDAALQLLVAGNADSLRLPVPSMAASANPSAGAASANASASASASASTSTSTSTSSASDRGAVSAMQTMGFSAEAAALALAATGPDTNLEKAASWLMDNPTAAAAAASDSNSHRNSLGDGSSSSKPPSSSSLSGRSRAASGVPLRANEYELTYGAGSMGISVGNNDAPAGAPKVCHELDVGVPGGGGGGGKAGTNKQARHIGCSWRDAHLPQPGHLIVAAECEGDARFRSFEPREGFAEYDSSDTLYQSLIEAVTEGRRPITLRFLAVDGVGPITSPSPVKEGQSDSIAPPPFSYASSYASPPPFPGASASASASSTASAASSSSSSASSSSSVEWEYKEDDGSFAAFSADHSALLSAAVREGRDMVELLSAGRIAAYTVLLHETPPVQINNSTGSSREVRRIGGQQQQQQHAPNPMNGVAPPESSGQEPPPPLSALRSSAASAAPAPPPLPPRRSSKLERQDSDEVSLFASLLSSHSSDDASGGAEVAVVADCECLSECPICMDALCSGSVVLFYAGGRRVCQHYFHDECADDVVAGGVLECPMCGRGFEEHRVLPDPLTDVATWFEMVDMAGRGALSKKEVAEALKAQLPINGDELEKNLDELWRKWDVNQTGDLSLSEVQTQLVRYLRKARGVNVPTEQTTAAQPQPPPATTTTAAAAAAAVAPPSLVTDREAWFTHFDSDGNGSLDKEELAVAVQRCFPDLAASVDVEMTIAVLVQACDTATPGVVTKDEFVRPNNGLADLMRASFSIS